ncbi:DUF567-domain-containing protein [Xylariomycetidae sp. FL2044]|nr:DUF567-domain-containing protein [Xylariomycetidae sp. FL2044]
MSKQVPILRAYPQPMGMFQPFIAQQSETLVLKEKVMSLSGDSFDIKTIDGRPVFQVKGETFSLSGRKSVMDMQGHHLFTIRKKHLRLMATYYAEDPSGNVIFELEGKFSLVSSKSIGTFTSASGKPESLLMKGDFFDRKADITDVATGEAVATINRKFFNMREIFGNQQTYVVTVAPNVDMAIIVAMCICLDERQNEK